MTSEPKRLHGRYKEFFSPQHHATVEAWYNNTETLQHQRRNMKTLVKTILEFDADAAKRRMRATDNTDTVAANAIYDQHNPQLLSSTTAESAVKWLAFATPSQRQMYRDTFGRICPPPLFSSSRQYTDDYSLTNKLTPAEMRQQPPKQLKGMDQFRKASEPITSETLVIGRHPTHTGTHYVWKTGSRLAQNVQQRAHAATFAGAPWGDYGKEASSNRSQWMTKTGEDYLLSSYDAAPSRPFQNYNENFCTELYKSAKKQAKSEKMRAEVNMFRASTGLGPDPALGESVLFSPDGTLLKSAKVTPRKGSVTWGTVSPPWAGGGGGGGVPTATTADADAEDGRPLSMLDVATVQLAATQKKYRPKPQPHAPPPHPCWKKEDGTLDEEFLDVAKRVRQTQYPLLHTGLKRRKMHMTKYHSRD